MLKARLPIEFLNVGVTNPLITQMLLSDKFFMNTKFVDLIDFYKLDIHKKMSLKSNWVIKGFVTPTLRNSIGGRTLGM